MPDPESIAPSSVPARTQRRPVRPKYQVFISSTFTDLHESRAKVTWELLKAGHIPVGMENFSAADERGWRTIQRTIDTSDYYVLVVGGRYGSIDESIGMSWTEREYHYAKGRGVPVLAFVRDAAHVTVDKAERGKAAERLEDFVKVLRGLHLCEKWTTEDDLCSRVVHAVRKAIDESELDGVPRPGWYRGDELPSTTTVDELANLSLENRKLRAQVEAFARSELVVLEVLDSEGNALRNVEASQPRYLIETEELGPAWPSFTPPVAIPQYFAVVSYEEFLGKVNRTFWLRIDLRNSGTKVARNVVVDLEVGGADEIVLSEESLSLEIGPDSKWMWDPAEHVYVDGLNSFLGGARVRQRVRHVSVGGRESLISMGLRGEIDSDSRLSFEVKYQAINEDGESVRGAFEIRVACVPERVTAERLKEIFD